MAIVGLARELPESGTATFDEQTGKRTYTRVFRVRTNDPHDGPTLVVNAPGIPGRYEMYATLREQDPNAFCVLHEPARVRGSATEWDVTVRYETLPKEERAADPRLWEPKMSWRPEKTQVPVVGTLKPGTLASTATQIFKEPIENSAGEPYDPQPTVPKTNGTLVITRNQSSFSPALALEYEDAVNDDPFFGADRRQAKIESIECPGREKIVIDDAEITYYPVTHVIKFLRETHDLRVLDRGKTYLTTTGTTASGAAQRKSFVDNDGHPYVGNLDGKGRSLAKVKGTTSSTLPSTTNGVYRRHRHFKELPFGALNLPQSFF